MIAIGKKVVVQAAAAGFSTGWEERREGGRWPLGQWTQIAARMSPYA
jgi:hypothetical protein